jgi:hypothetical protein
VFEHELERTSVFQSILGVSPVGHRDEHWQARLTAELWVMRCDGRRELGKPIDPAKAGSAPEKPSATRRKLTAYLSALKALERQAETLGGRASTRAVQHLTALRAIAHLAVTDLELYRLRVREWRKKKAGRGVRDAKEDRSTPELKRLSGQLDWVPESKRFHYVSALHAFATETTPLQPGQIRLRLKNAKRRESRRPR